MMICNIKNLHKRSYHSTNPKYFPRYLADLYYRSNRRFDLRKMASKLGHISSSGFFLLLALPTTLMADPIVDTAPDPEENEIVFEWGEITRLHDTPATLADISPLDATYTDKEGFMIVTTNDLTHQLTKLQDYITHKKNFRGFNVFVATESDYEIGSQVALESQARGAPPGRVLGKEILNFLRTKYVPLNLKYVIFIGDARPDMGTTPMLRVSSDHPAWCIYNNFNLSEEEYFRLNEQQKKEHDKMMTLCDPKTGQHIEFGEVTSDYPYADLGTNWDADNDGFLDPADDKTDGVTRHPEVYVGRVPYYGEDSDYGKAADVDAILERFIRYETEDNIAWRYNHMVEAGKNGMYNIIDFLEKNRINYQLFSRSKNRAIGMPSLNARNGGRDVPNWQIIQDYGVGHYGNHSHGGPLAMEGLRSRDISGGGIHDKQPTILVLGACSVGDINHPNNLTSTLLRFHSVAACGGTGGVTGYGGNGSGWDENYIWNGKSIGEARWDWYGHLYRYSKGTPRTTGMRINLYGDPSVIPYQFGITPPYSFFADPIAGKFGLFNIRKNKTSASHITTLENNKDEAVTIKVTTDKTWLIPSVEEATLQPNEKMEVLFTVDNDLIIQDTPTDNGVYYRADMFFEDEKNEYKTVRPFVLKRFIDKMQNYYNFDEGTTYYDLLAENPTTYTGEAFVDPGPNVSGAISLKNSPPIIAPYLTEKENFTMSFWLKGDIADNATILSSSFISLTKKAGNKIAGTFADDRKIVNKKFSFTNDALNDGGWHHYLFTLNQEKGRFYVYLDGVQVATLKSRPYLTYGTQYFYFGKLAGVGLDELMLFNKYMEDEDIADLMAGNFVEPIYPKYNEKFVSDKDLTFKILKGEGIVSSQLVVKNLDTTEEQIIEPSSDGNFYVPKLLPYTKYRWKVTAQTKDGKTISSDSTPFNTARKLPDLTPIRLYRGSTHTERLPDTLTLGKGYIFSGMASYARLAHLLDIKVYASNSSGSVKELIAETRFRYKTMELKWQFHVPTSLEKDNSSLTDFLFEFKNPVWSPSQGYLDLNSLSLVEVNAEDLNFAPVVSDALANQQFTADVGELGYAINLNDYVTDPEGGDVTYKLLVGPAWAGIQANDLFSNFGPTEDYRGKTATFDIEAKDEVGNITIFQVVINVI